jgi:hypothetical protein
MQERSKRNPPQEESQQFRHLSKITKRKYSGRNNINKTQRKHHLTHLKKSSDKAKEPKAKTD